MDRLASFFSLDRLYNYLGLLCGGLAAALGGWDVPLQALVGAMALDYASGVLVAVKERKLSSAVGFAGLARKLTIFLIVIVAGSLDLSDGISPRQHAVSPDPSVKQGRFFCVPALARLHGACYNV